MRALAISLFALLAPTAQAQDWSGPYVGLGASRSDGEQDAGAAFPLEGSPISLFGGYNWQNGNLVFGGELALSSNAITLTDFPLIEYNKLIDLKGRVGYAAGRTLVYGVIGVSQAEYVNGSFTDDLDGWSYGLGADVLISDRIFAGAEYLRRNLDHTNPGVSTDISTFTLRVGMNF